MEQILEVLKTMQKKSDANRKTHKEEMIARIDVNTKTTLEDRKAGQAEIREEIHVFRSDLE
jgi:hypothetical protein